VVVKKAKSPLSLRGGILNMKALVLMPFANMKPWNICVKTQKQAKAVRIVMSNAQKNLKII